MTRKRKHSNKESGRTGAKSARRSISSIESIFPNRVLLDVLTVLILHADQEYYQRQIAEQTGRTLIEVQRALRRIERAGLLTKSRRGNRLYYSARQNHPAFHDLRALLLKTTGLVDTLRDALAGAASRIRLAFVFGSIVSGKETPSSDVDLLIVGNIKTEEIVGVLSRAEKSLRREISVLVYSPKEFRHAYHTENHFIASVVKEPKIWIIGDDNELERIVR